MAFLADAVLVLHFGVVLFVVGGLLAVLLGQGRWPGTDRWSFRLAHLGANGYVAGQQWFGVTCPLTTLEHWLRVQAGQAVHDTSFVAHWLQRLLFFDAPDWVFTVAYTAFALAVALAWWRYPPRRRPTAAPAL